MRAWLKSLFRQNADPDTESAPPLPAEATSSSSTAPWIGVDLDGTLAEYNGWRGLDHIGKPIPLMRERIEAWLDAGYGVKIFTARASVPGGDAPVRKWLAQHGLPPLEVTNQKDFQMIELWDDRAVQVVSNSGRPIIRASAIGKPLSPLLSREIPSTTCEVAPVAKSERGDDSLAE